MFLEGSDLTPINEHIDELLSGLTEWQPTATEADSSEIKTVEVTGEDYADAIANVNHLFVRNLWGDTLPIVPPTQEYVDWILTGTEDDPESKIGTIYPRGGIATVRMVAVSLAMAGGRPEHLPLLLSATRLMIASKSGMGWNATTNSLIPAFVVNGPIASQIRLGSGYGLLGPDPTHPASQILGRAVRLILQDLGGALPGTGTMAMFGGMRATNAFFAEDDEGTPEGWTTWAEDRGFTRNQNVVTMTIVNSMSNVYWHFGDAASNDASLRLMAGVMAAPNENRFTHPASNTSDNTNLITGLVLLPRGYVASLVDANGYSKEDVKQILWDNSKVTYEEIESWGYIGKVKENAAFADVMPGDEIPVCPAASQVTIITAGGDQSGHGYFMGPVLQGEVVSEEVSLPSNWDDLLLDAEIDLGTPAATH